MPTLQSFPLRWPSRPARLFGFALGTALAGGVALAAWAASEDAVPHRPPPPMALAMGGPMLLPHGPMLDKVLDDVQASPTQRAQTHQILDAAESDLHADRDAARADHDRLAELFSQPVVDPVAVEALRERMEARHDAESRRMTQALVDVGQVLSVEQRQQIARHAAPPRPGRGYRPDLPATQP